MNAPNDGSPDAALPASDLEADPAAAPAAWYGPDGSIVSCTEKVKVLEENWRELRAALQDALDDAVLMGCTAAQFKSEYKRLIDALECDYAEQATSGPTAGK